ncbi:MAG: terminase [Massilioclostridium sp.]|nr:MAG: terminase [Massilioclostridium sp.]
MSYLLEYRNEIQKGNIIAGNELITELDNLISDLNNPRYYYDTWAANLRMEFMENCIKLTKSPFYGQPMKLMLWQKAFIETVYSFKMADTGFDRFRKILLLIARKNTKSETSSGLELSEGFCGNDGSDIVCSSNDDSQANILYDAIDTMRMMIDPDSLDTWRNNRFIRINLTNSKIFKISDRTRNKEGRNIDFAVVDEVHEMKESTILNAIEQSMSLKDNPKMIVISTEGFVNDGALDELLVEGRKIIRGESDDLDSERFLPWLYTQDSELEVWQDRSSWVKSNPTLGMVKKWEYLDIQVDAAKKSKSKRVFVLAKDFNIKQNNATAWLSLEDYAYEAVFDIEDFRGCFCLGAVDLAETTDLTAAKILLMKPGDKTKYIYQHYWIPESKLEKSDDTAAGAKYQEWARDGYLTICDGNDVDLTLVADWFYMLYLDYDIRLYKCGYDQRFSKDFLNRMEEYGFECEMVLQNKYVMSAPAKLVEADFKSRLINYNNNPIDAFCLQNAAIEVDEQERILVVKVQGQPGKKIDGAVVLVILYEIFRRYRSDFTRLQE